jgi:hypothetical protein
MPVTDPAYWSEQVRHTLQRYDESLLRPVTARLFRPRNQWPAEELIDRSLAALENAAVVDRRLKELEPAQRRALALIAHSRQPRWHLGNLIEMLMALGHSDALPPILALLEGGMLFPCLPATGKRLKLFEQWLGQAGSTGLSVFAPPQVASRAFGEDLGLPDLSEGVRGLETERGSGTSRNRHPKRSHAVTPPATHFPTLPPSHSLTVHEADGLEWLLRLTVLWQEVSASPIRRTQQGDFFKRDLERLHENSILNAAAADSLSEVPVPGLLAVFLAEQEGILEEHKGELRAGPMPHVWNDGLLGALASLWAALLALERWNPLDGGPATPGRGNPYPSAYLLGMLLLARLPPDGWAFPSALEEWLFSHHPFWSGESIRPSQRRSWLAGFLLGLAYQLKLVQVRRCVEGNWLVRLSPLGRWALGLAEAPKLAVYPQTLLVQPNLEIIAYRQGLTPGLAAQLARLADWKNLGAACTLQLSSESVYRGLQSGLSFQQIVQVLERHAMRPLPATVVDSLRTWAGKRERITVYPSVTLFEFASPDDLNEALSRGLPGQRLTDRLAAVSRENGVEFRHFRLTGTRDYGLPPEKCIEVADDGVTLTIDGSRSDLLVETDIARFAELLEPSNRDGRRQYRITLESMTAGRSGGITLRSLEDWFVQRAGQPITPAARLLLAGNVAEPALLRRQLVLHLPTPEFADGLEQWPATRPLVGERLGPATLAVAEEHLAELRRQLRSLGVNLQE